MDAMGRELTFNIIRYEKKREKEIIDSNVAEGDLLVSRRVVTEKLPFEKETSFPSIIFQGLCENMGGVMGKCWGDLNWSFFLNYQA